MTNKTTNIANITKNDNAIKADCIMSQVNTSIINMNTLRSIVILRFKNPGDGTTINIPEKYILKKLKMIYQTIRFLQIQQVRWVKYKTTSTYWLITK